MNLIPSSVYLLCILFLFILESEAGKSPSASTSSFVAPENNSYWQGTPRNTVDMSSDGRAADQNYGADLFLILFVVQMK